MLGRRSRLDTTRAEQESEPVRRMLKFDRKLREQLEKLASQLHETQHELNLTPEHIENVVRVGMELAEQRALIPVEVDKIWPDPIGVRKSSPVFRLPALSGSWVQCAEGLPHPHTRAIRPIVFDPALAAGRDDVVLAHLNHRLEFPAGIENQRQRYVAYRRAQVRQVHAAHPLEWPTMPCQEP